MSAYLPTGLSLGDDCRVEAGKKHVAYISKELPSASRAAYAKLFVAAPKLRGALQVILMNLRMKDELTDLEVVTVRVAEAAMKNLL